MRLYRFEYLKCIVLDGEMEICETQFLADNIDVGIEYFMSDNERVCNDFTLKEIVNGCVVSIYSGSVVGYQYKLEME